MGVLFISHSSRDNDAAVRVRNWLRENGWNQVFLDLDPSHGVAPGHRWQQELKQAGERCSGVLVLISPGWVASDWCRTEFLVADQLGKKIFPLLILPTPFDSLLHDLTGRFQFADISTPEKESDGFGRLAIGLKRAGLDPTSFEWPPNDEPGRPIYRGLESLDEKDAAIFFGRDALITKGLDALRRMRDGAPERMLVILGASGAGKSSFLKAGLVARLARDEENFLVLPAIRPERAALSGERGLVASLSADPALLMNADDVLNRFSALRASLVDRLLRYSEPGRESPSTKPPTLIVPIDQAEELFAAEAAETERMLELLVPAVLADENVVVVATIRSDSFEKLQREPRLTNLAHLPFSLPPIPHGVFKDVIECPARLANPPITVEPALTEKLIKDLADDDALPLLAFTLERLLHRNHGRRILTLANYASELGGLQGAITAAVDAAFANAARDPTLPGSRAELEKLARSAFIPALVQIDDADAEPRRRVELLGVFPESTRALIRRFVDERLLVCDRREIDGVAADMVEVAHEAILRQWPALKSWIAEERDSLRSLDGMRTGAAEWRKHARRDGEIVARPWLIHSGARLEEAEALLARPDFAPAISEDLQAYIVACRAAENSERMRERQGLARTRKLQHGIWVLVGIAALLVLVAGLGTLQLLGGIASEAADTLLVQAQNEADTGNYLAAVRFAIASINRANWVRSETGNLQTEAEIRGAAVLFNTLAVLRGHVHWVMGADFSPNGRRIVTASRDKTARIWDARTGAEIRLLRGHSGPVYSAAFSPDGKRIVTASGDGTARIWDADSGSVLTVIRGDGEEIYCAVFSPDGKWVLTGSADKTARVWDSTTGAQRIVLRGHLDDVVGAVFSRDGRRIATASGDRTAALWDFATGAQLAVLHGHTGIVEGVAFSPDGRHVATGSDDQTVRIWDAENGRQLTVLNAQGEVNSVAYSFDGSRLVTSYDNAARIWDTATGQEILELHGHDGQLDSAEFNRSGTEIVTASQDRTARVWDAEPANHLLVLRGHTDGVNSARFSPDGKRVVTGSSDKTVRIWSSGTGVMMRELQGHDNLVESGEFSPDGTKVVSASDDKTARVWDAASGRELVVLRGHKGPVYDAAFSPDGKQIATASVDGTAVIWDSTTGDIRQILRGHSATVTSATFSPDGQRVVTSSNDRTARIWDVGSGTCLKVLRGHTAVVTSAVFSTDGKRILTAGRDKVAIVWDARSGRELMILVHDDPLLAAAFSRDGTRIVTASLDKAARLWDAQTGVEIAVYRGHQGQLESANFSPDGKHLVTASNDETARIWNIAGLGSAAGPDLIRSTCRGELSRGLGRFSAEDLSAAKVLDPQLDTDACNPPSPLARLGKILRAGFLHGS